MPCKPRMSGCRADCLHRALVEDYRAARERDEAVRDAVTIGYATDERLYAETTPLVTFGSWLSSLAGSGAYSRGTPPDGWEGTA